MILEQDEAVPGKTFICLVFSAHSYTVGGEIRRITTEADRWSI